MPGFSWYDYCPGCGTKTSASSQLVLSEKVREHLEKCIPAQKKKAEAAAAKAAQGNLF